MDAGAVFHKAIPVTFDNRVFSLSAVKKAAYKYIDYFSVDIRINGSEIHCLLTYAAGTSKDRCLQISDDFQKEVLDQELREQIKAETEPIRNLILAHAFSKTELAENEQIQGN